MSDTQWPRYYVFKQDAPEDSHHSCGTVHAPDPEMALQIARDVFVRRPACHSLWVAPAAQVWAGDGSMDNDEVEPATQGHDKQAFLIFTRPNQRDPHQYQLELEAGSAAEALSHFQDQRPELAALGAWAVPKRSIIASQAGEEEAWFKPADEKPYRHGSFYHPDRLLRKIRTKDD